VAVAPAAGSVLAMMVVLAAAVTLAMAAEAGSAVLLRKATPSALRECAAEDNAAGEDATADASV